MRPEDVGAASTDDMDGPDDGLPADVELAALETELTVAGARARRGAPAAPTAAFAATLRRHLLGSGESAPGAASSGTATVQRGSGAAAAGSVAGSVAAPTRGHESAPHPPGAPEPGVTGRAQRIAPLPRWSILTISAAVLLAVAGLGAGFLRPAPVASRVASAVGATLVRAGSTTTLTAGEFLAAGDEIRVGSTGSATLQFGDSRARLAAGADLVLTSIDHDAIALDQRAGRAWHRVVVPRGGRYEVTTGAVRWTATGTAFDLDRVAVPAGDVIRELSVEDTVIGEGPGLRVTILAGDGATVALGSNLTVATRLVPAADAMADSWLVTNAAADAAAGFDVGLLQGAPILLTVP